MLVSSVILNGHLVVFNTKKLCLKQTYCEWNWWANERELFFMLFFGGCFTEVATYFKSYWKHCN